MKKPFKTNKNESKNQMNKSCLKMTTKLKSPQNENKKINKKLYKNPKIYEFNKLVIYLFFFSD